MSTINEIQYAIYDLKSKKYFQYIDEWDYDFKPFSILNTTYYPNQCEAYQAVEDFESDLYEEDVSDHKLLVVEVLVDINLIVFEGVNRVTGSIGITDVNQTKTNEALPSSKYAGDDVDFTNIEF
jgi:hypothetical protein